jgi:hypothetical protein
VGSAPRQLPDTGAVGVHDEEHAIALSAGIAREADLLAVRRPRVGLLLTLPPRECVSCLRPVPSARIVNTGAKRSGSTLDAEPAAEDSDLQRLYGERLERRNISRNSVQAVLAER